MADSFILILAIISEICPAAPVIIPCAVFIGFETPKIKNFVELKFQDTPSHKL